MEQQRYGEVPTGPVIFAACDATYFKKFAPAFVSSIDKNTTQDIHLHVINPDDEVFALSCILNARAKKKVTYTYQDSDLSGYTVDQKRALYASLRFLVAPFLLQHAGKMLILDIDCLVKQQVVFPDKPLGYFPREPLAGTQGWENEGTKVAAGSVYFDAQAMNVCNAVSETLGGLDLRWFNDQIALNHVFSQVPEEHVHAFDGNFMDWEFKEGTVLWTGKGPRKYENEAYVAEQKVYHDAIMSTIEEPVLLMPRLDIPFKKFGIAKAGTVNEPIRKYWKMYQESWQDAFPEGVVVQSQRWMFNPKIEMYCKDLLFIPHVEKHDWSERANNRYYMQTVFPWLFTEDEEGWAGGGSYIRSFDPHAKYSLDAWREMKEYAKSGGSKFKHLQVGGVDWSNIDKGNYIIVPLQLPHDDTIKYHSDFSVEHFVRQICEWASTTEGAPQVVFKGHPVNFSAMEPLKKIIDGYDNTVYIADANINQMIENCRGMFVLNGGSGQEAMIAETRVAGFGRSDYLPAVINGDISNVQKTYTDMMEDDMAARVEMYQRWFDWYLNVCIDVRKIYA